MPSIDHRIDTDPARHFHQGLAHLGGLEVDHLCAKLLGQFEPVRIMINRDHLARAHDDGGLDGAQTHRW
ncbi:hypothetical protein FHR91_002629 [Erythrobacter lutimaris]|nr:hypothetical protein [Alteriqipengyuania lutimaris]